MGTGDTFRFSTRMRVRWAEVDAQGIVFNGHYLTYFDTAASDYYRALGVPYPEGIARLGGDLYVKKSTLEYHASARYDDVLDIAIRCASVGRTSLTFAWAVVRDGRRLVSGETVYVFADPRTQTKAEIPAPLRDAFARFEAGQPMITLAEHTFAELGEDARALRAAVFVGERGVPPELEWDALDADAVHLVARGPLGDPLAVGRLVRTESGEARIGRMAVLRTMRGAGVGLRVLEALIDRARARGDASIVLHAMQDVVPFYAKAGFVAVGEAYDEAGIPHRTMRRVLTP